MQRIAIITAGQISNVKLCEDGYTPATGEMLEADAIAAGIPHAVHPAAPIFVSMTSLKLALAEAGLYDPVVAAIAAIPDATQRTIAGIWFANPTASNDHPLVAQIADAIGASSDQIAAIFTAAQALDAA